MNYVFISKLVRLHFKRNYSVCAHERLEATVCIGLSARATTGDIFHPFHLGRQHSESPTPPTVRPRFTQLVHPISIASSPSPRSIAEPSLAPPCSPRPCARSSASSLAPLPFPRRGGPRLAIFVCSPATLEHIDAVTLASPVVRPGLH